MTAAVASSAIRWRGRPLAAFTCPDLSSAPVKAFHAQHDPGPIFPAALREDIASLDGRQQARGWRGKISRVA
jgi:hypothetical protein